MTTPNQPGPPDAIGGGDISPLSNLSEATWRANQLGKIEGFDQAHTSFGIPWLNQRVDTFIDGQLALNDRLDLLSPLLDYGSTYMKTSSSFASGGFMKFHNQIGPMQGCEVAGGDYSIRLLDKGLWDIRAQVFADVINFLGGEVQWSIRVYTPGGSLYSQTRGRFSSQSPISQAILCSVVVPEPRYLVAVHVNAIAAFRGLLGGPDRTRLTVQHISRDTSTGEDGT